MDDLLRSSQRAFLSNPAAETALDFLQAAIRAADPTLQGVALDWLVEMERWDHWERSVREGVGSLLSTAIDRLQFLGLEDHELGDQAHQVAVFELRAPPLPTRMVLIPGGQIRLGWEGDLEQSLVALEGVPDYWETRADFAETIQTNHLTVPRTVPLRPFLIEQTAIRSGANYLEKVPPDYTSEWALISDHVEQEGLRLLSPDECEHACSAGSRSLFRWGDQWPLADPYMPEGFDLHKRPNAFGLTFQLTSYECEITDTYLVVTGGDGGSFVCGGDGSAAWITLASSYMHFVTTAEYEYYEGSFVRRALSLPGAELTRNTTRLVQGEWPIQ